MKILFFGIGSIGKRHANILNKYHNATLYAVRTNEGQETHNLPIKEFSDINDAMTIEPDICFITNPTHLHIPTVFDCIEYNVSIFIEKPISNTYKDVDKLGREINKRNALAYVAYNMRFHPVIEYLKQIISSDDDKPIYFRIICGSYLPSWRPNQDYEISYSAKKEMGGGVILDVSHEIDYIDWLFGDIYHITGYYGKISNLKITSEDVTEMQFKCGKNILGSLHLNYFSCFDERRIQIYYNSKYIEGDLLDNTVTTYKNGEKAIKKFSGNRDDTFIKQMEFFLKQYRLNNVDLMNNYNDASRIFKKIIEFKNRGMINERNISE